MESRKQDEEKIEDGIQNIRPSAFTKPPPSSSTSLLYIRAVAKEEVGEKARINGNSPPPGFARLSPISSAGGASRRRRRANPGATTAPETDTTGQYLECLRNHAASLGGHVLDGCCEFMAGAGGNALTCAACACHRSFHRKDGTQHPIISPASSLQINGAPLPPIPTPHDHHHHRDSFGVAAAATVRSGGATTESSSEELIKAVPPVQDGGVAVAKKRFRTKFTAEQKEKMVAFAERVGWRMQKQEEAMIEELCGEIGVSRQVFKVWMHNNKHSKQQQQELKQERI